MIKDNNEHEFGATDELYSNYPYILSSRIASFLFRFLIFSQTYDIHYHQGEILVSRSPSLYYNYIYVSLAWQCAQSKVRQMLELASSGTNNVDLEVPAWSIRWASSSESRLVGLTGRIFRHDSGKRDETPEYVLDIVIVLRRAFHHFRPQLRQFAEHPFAHVLDGHFSSRWRQIELIPGNDYRYLLPKGQCVIHVALSVEEPISPPA